MRIIKGYTYEDGIDFFYPQKIYEYCYEQSKLLISSLFYDREPQLGGKLIKFEMASPCKDVIRIKVNYHQASKSGLSGFPIRDACFSDVNFYEEEDCFYFISGKISLKIYKDPWKIDFVTNDRLITTTQAKGFGVIRFNPNFEDFFTEP